MTIAKAGRSNAQGGSLSQRLRRLEQTEEQLGIQDRAESMRVAREARLRMSSDERAAAELRRLDRARAELAAADRPGDPVQAMRRRFAQRHAHQP